MTDREMLELAAKAAGASDCAGVQSGWEGFICLRVLWDEGGDYEDWNPLTDDGDALRLAVKLHIDFKCYGNTVRTWVGNQAEQRVIASVEELCEHDPYAATRRAITRAAAEIGRAMP